MSSDSIFTSEINKKNSGNDSFPGYDLLFSNSRSLIYRTTDEGKTYLLKTAASDDSRLRKIIRREWEIAMICSHPNIVHCYSFKHESKPGDCIVMEYIEGRNLREFIAEKPSTALRKRVLMQLLDAAGYLHSRGIIHNDLKPENILVTRADNDVKLIDLGLADDDIHQLGKACGYSKYYCSPELIDAAHGGPAAPDCRSDIFSIGCIIADLFGPFRYRSVASKCTRKNPRCRYQNIDAVKRTLSIRKILPFATIALIICILLTAVIVRQKETAVIMQRELDSLQNDYAATARADSMKIASLQETISVMEAENTAREKARNKIMNQKRCLMGEVDRWAENTARSIPKKIEMKGQDVAKAEFMDEYVNFFAGITGQSDPEITEEIRSYLVEKMQEIQNRFF